MKDKLKILSDEAVNSIIKLAWHDYTSFDDIKKKFGISENEVIQIMRQELRSNNFRKWRKRVTGKLTKHGALHRYKLKNAQAQNLKPEELDFDSL